MRHAVRPRRCLSRGNLHKPCVPKRKPPEGGLKNGAGDAARTRDIDFGNPQCIVKDVVSILNASEDSISLAIEEVEPADWAEKVYRPEISNNPPLY